MVQSLDRQNGPHLGDWAHYPGRRLRLNHGGNLLVGKRRIGFQFVPPFLQNLWTSLYVVPIGIDWGNDRQFFKKSIELILVDFQRPPSSK